MHLQTWTWIAIFMSLGLLQCSADRRSSSGDSTGGDAAFVGDPCIPTNESDPSFTGFRINDETIETGAPACGGGVCLVNHFQGRVSCPLGQAPSLGCTGPDDMSCGAGATCVVAATLSPGCDPASADKGASQCAGFGNICNPKFKVCTCAQSADCPTGSYCAASSSPHVCTRYVCHTAGDCQSAGADESQNEGKACCLPGTDTPVTSAVCGQCKGDSNRDAEKAVYCSCRCGPADGQPPEDNADFCKCPSGFECQEIRPNLGIGDPALTGKYCIRAGSVYQDEQQCSLVKGYFNSQICKGIGL